ncbi:unnamed protein product [Caenorhabditis brenneri]
MPSCPAGSTGARGTSPAGRLQADRTGVCLQASPATICLASPATVCLDSPSTVCLAFPVTGCLASPNTVCLAQPSTVCLASPGDQGGYGKRTRGVVSLEQGKSDNDARRLTFGNVASRKGIKGLLKMRMGLAEKGILPFLEAPRPLTREKDCAPAQHSAVDDMECGMNE